MGIRDTAMSHGNKTKNPETHYLDSQYPYPTTQNYDYGYGYDNGFGTGKKSYQQKLREGSQEATEQIKIEMEISYKEIGVIADVDNPNYNFNKATSEAEEIAMKKLMLLAGKDVKLRYRVDITVEDWIDCMTVEMKLTKRKQKHA